MRNHYPGPGNVGLAFATPILQRLFDDAESVNQGLTRIVLEREKTMPSAGRSNVGGWHSNDDLFEWPYPEIATFRGWLGEAVGEITNVDLDGRVGGQMDVQMDGGAWVNLCRDGGYNKIHNHPGCSWSGVYYVSTGVRAPDAPPDAGCIEFLDPRMGATETGFNGPDALPKLRVEAVPGLMVVFPSWLYHYVNPFRGSGERISIAFNVNLRFQP